MIRKTLLASALSVAVVSAAQAADPSGTYAFDRKDAHQFVTFEISHLGFSTLMGRFNDFNGEFHFDAKNPENSRVEVTLETTSVDSNHAERDRHLRSEDFLHVSEYPQATFRSTRIEVDEDGDEADVYGELTLRGVTREIKLDVDLVGYGEDPWGGYRLGFDAETEIRMADFGIPTNLGQASEVVELRISVEGVRQ